ncbi:hypothetical protein H5410_022008 [Solanum commersonii]|uniref:Uncharacterized protein n=1 Tax=Solanum commersonii TaxID=4109 RepID=A0A9J5ZFJ4_SOLCO|nr:hypothetical protein H5410_022008 [Solanum commersonii]
MLRRSHSAQLVRITDTLGDPPFGLLHCLSPLSFSIFASWIIGRYSTSSLNCSATRWLLHFTADLIFSFRVQYTETKGEDKTFWQLTDRVWRFSDLHFFGLSVAFVPFC